MKLVERTCERCGRTFPGTRRTKYCPYCQPLRKAEQAHQAYMDRHRLCEGCGRVIIGNTIYGEKYCKNCYEKVQQEIPVMEAAGE